MVEKKELLRNYTLATIEVSSKNMYISSTILHQLVKDIPTIKQGIDKILNNEKELLNFRDLIFF